MIATTAGAAPIRHLFVVGLHRSGTTMLARLLGEQSFISAFRNTGVMMDEGQHLQTVFTRYDEPAWFSFHPKAHQTETSPLATDANARRLRTQWSAYWNEDKPVLLEKSPGNLFRTRILQRFFPDAGFVLIHRHPVAHALAMEKWQNPAPPGLALWNWVRSHDLLLKDRSHLRRTLRLSYEDLVADPPTACRRLSRFLGRTVKPPTFAVRSDVNQRYFADWRARHHGTPLQRAEARIAEATLERRIGRWGYSFADAR